MVMKMERVYSDRVKEPEPGLWSNCKKINDQVFISGLVAFDNDGNLVGANDPYEQARFIFARIKDYIEAAGGRIDDIIKLNIYVTDMRHRPGVLKARREFFSGDFPCSTLVGVTSLFDTRAIVEIDATGFVGAGAD